MNKEIPFSTTVAFLIVSIFLLGCSQFSEPQGLNNSNNQKLNMAQIEEPLEATFSSIKLNIINKKCISCHKPDGDKKASAIPLTRESEVVKGYTDLGDLIVPGEPAKSLFYRVMLKEEKYRGRTKLMPPPDTRFEAVTEEELQVVAAWISGVVKAENTDCSEAMIPLKPGKPVEPTVPETPLILEPAILNYTFIRTEILEKKCIVCHKADGKADELIFGNRNEIINLRNDIELPLVVPGKPEQSLMYLSLIKDETIRQDTRLMPPKKAIAAGKIKDITAQEVELIKKWIAEGAQ